MKEYEWSFKVKSISPFLEYCRKNGYKEFEPVSQNRVVYHNQNNSHIIARLTTDKVGTQEKTEFDFKNISHKNENLKVSDETIPLKVTKSNLKAIQSILDVLGFYVAADNYRTRYVFKKGSVKFEIDDYSKPTKNCVFAIEGEESAVEKAKKDILSKLGNFLE